MAILESGNVLLKTATAIGMLCSIRNDVNSVSALIVANFISFKKKVSILEHALPAACTCCADTTCF